MQSVLGFIGDGIEPRDGFFGVAPLVCACLFSYVGVDSIQDDFAHFADFAFIFFTMTVHGQSEIRAALLT